MQKFLTFPLVFSRFKMILDAVQEEEFSFGLKLILQHKDADAVPTLMETL